MIILIIFVLAAIIIPLNYLEDLKIQIYYLVISAATWNALYLVDFPNKNYLNARNAKNLLI